MPSLTELIAQAGIGLTGVTAMFAGAYWAVLRGKLHTSREFDEMVKAKDHQIEILVATATRKDEQIKELMVIGETVTRVLDALESVAVRRRRR